MNYALKADYKMKETLNLEKEGKIVQIAIAATSQSCDFFLYKGLIIRQEEGFFWLMNSV